MKRVIVRSVHDAFDYVMQHYYPFGLEDLVERADTYTVISIQDTHTGGFGLKFAESNFCKGVLTLYFDDVLREVKGAVMFTDEMADQIVDFILQHRDVDTLLIHCYGGQSRSRAVGAFAVKLLGADNSKYFATGDPNRLVYDKLVAAWKRKKAAIRDENKKPTLRAEKNDR